MAKEFVPHPYWHVPEGWRRACQLVDHVQHVLGATIIERATGKPMDAGQAICREAYGRDWMNSPAFQAADGGDAAPSEYIAAAERLIAGEADWPATCSHTDGETQ